MGASTSSMHFSLRRMLAPSLMIRRAASSSSRPSFTRWAFSSSRLGFPSAYRSLTDRRVPGGYGTAANMVGKKGRGVRLWRQRHKHTDKPRVHCEDRTWAMERFLLGCFTLQRQEELLPKLRRQGEAEKHTFFSGWISIKHLNPYHMLTTNVSL